jgi:hypothetical protein
MKQLDKYLSKYAEDEQAIILEGLQAKLDELPITSNPYVEGQGDWMLWDEGYTLDLLTP